MMTIGEFAALTGLTPKALRHYDSKGVLSPAAVDPRSGYRGYAFGQLRAAGLIGVLRAADLPLAVVSEALAAGDPLATLARERERLLAEREAQDAALLAAEWMLEQGSTTEVRREHVGSQRFAYIDLEDLPEPVAGATDAERAAYDEAGTERANATFARVFEAVRAAGGDVTGPWWFQYLESTMGDPDATPMTLRCAWPVAGDFGGAEQLGDGVLLGLLPEVTELCVDIPHGMTPPEVTLPPGQLELFEAVIEEVGEERATLAELRTVGKLDSQGQPIGLTLRFAVDAAA
ncbi:MAG: MerR family DNA-binding transcriptional regulator [Leucobacter sp.]|nr:MerR family DNA-binding transcriptional regulator [Leucobacter sp.]